MHIGSRLLLAATLVWLALPLLVVAGVAFCEPGAEGAIGRLGSLEGLRALSELSVLSAIRPTAGAALCGSAGALLVAFLVAAVARLQSGGLRVAIVALMGIPMLTSIVPRTLAVLGILAGPKRLLGTALGSFTPAGSGIGLDVVTVGLGFIYTFTPYLFFVFLVALGTVSDPQVAAARDAGAEAHAIVLRLFWPTVRDLARGLWLVTCVLMSLDIVVPSLFGDGKVMYLGPAVEYVFFEVRNRPAALALMWLGVLAAAAAAALLQGCLALSVELGARAARRLGPQVQADG